MSSQYFQYEVLTPNSMLPTANSLLPQDCCCKLAIVPNMRLWNMFNGLAKKCNAFNVIQVYMGPYVMMVNGVSLAVTQLAIYV